MGISLVVRMVAIPMVLVVIVLGAACGSSSSGQIVFVSMDGGDSEISLLDPSSGEVTRLTDNESNDFSPRWSPDFKQIVYLSNGSGNVAINLVDGKAESIVSLIEGLSDDASPVWSPDGKRIAFISHQSGSPEVYLMSTNGGPITRITSNSTADRLGDWSPDGEWLVFSSSGNETMGGLWLRNPDGVNLVHLTSGEDSAPVWSPNGQHIAFLREVGGNNDVYIISESKDGAWQDDAELTRLTLQQSDNHSLAWSPDSKVIAFASVNDNSSEIYLMRADGSKRQQLTNNEADDLAPTWSPDGKQIAFVSHVYGAGEIFVMDVDSGKQNRLTNSDTEDESPDW
jgi:Tol biopolymer transport system component